MSIPTPASWTLIGTAGSLPIAAGAGTTVAAPAIIDCPITALSEQDLLDLFGRILPVSYLAPIQSPGPGYEVLQGYAALFARLSQAVETLGCQSFILTAPSGSYATGTVELYRARPNPEGITVVVKAGTVVECSRGGQRYATTADVTFAPADLGPFQVGVQALAYGCNFNVPGASVSAGWEPLPGEIDLIRTLVEDPDYGDPEIFVRQTSVWTGGGSDAALDQHGADRGLPRITGETDDVYRVRIRTLPDNISYDAFERNIRRYLLPYNVTTYEFIETWEIEYQTCWDAPATAFAGSNFDPNLFVYDDPRSPTPFRNRWLDENDYRGAVIVVVPDVAAISDVGMAWDDTALTPDQFRTALGGRAYTAWDVPSDFALGLQGGYDGFDLGKQALYKGLYDTLQNIKAAGISVTVELRGQ